MQAMYNAVVRTVVGTVNRFYIYFTNSVFIAG